MAKVAWLQRYSVGVEELDEQHQAIFRIVNQLDDAISAGAKHEIVGTFSRVMDYARAHFAHEEAFMARIEYAELEGHQREHARFVSKITNLWEGFLAGEDDIAPELQRFLTEWLIGHIDGTDGDYALAAAAREHSSSTGSGAA
jgi:hemerythrin